MVGRPKLRWRDVIQKETGVLMEGRSAIPKNIGVRGSNRVLPEWRTQIVCHADPAGRKTIIMNFADPIF